MRSASQHAALAVVVVAIPAVAGAGLYFTSSVAAPVGAHKVSKSVAAVVRPSTSDIFDQPAGWTLLASLPSSYTYEGASITAPVIGHSGTQVEVDLPQRGNPPLWIDTSTVQLSTDPYSVLVSLAAHTLTVLKAGGPTQVFPVATGTAVDPTPTGSYYIAFYAPAPDPSYGPFVLVTSAHSQAISDWEESGDAMIAIHGPLGEDALIGQSISHGCIRMLDSDLTQLRDVPVGTPINILAGVGQ
jgi:lipoprotein-anchoring transpeptidase ErfK/SrfK